MNLTRWTWALLAPACLAAPLVARAADDYVIPPGKKDHWAWRRPARPPVPAVEARGRLKNSIDAFVLAKLEAAGIAPAAPATREQLLRRGTFDLVGLPPTPAEIDAFLADRSPNAWEKVVDHLLASPHYGERWGRHWLDLARYADSNGYEHDEIRPDAWRYRDYVIRSFNAGKPYDRFVKEQLAGDELDPDDPDCLIATGFNLLGPDMTDSADQAQRRQDTLNDMTDTASLAFLGLTAGCARCHDHKFEPIPQSDYYRLQAFFAPATFVRDQPVAERERRDAFDRATREYAELVRPTQDAIKKLEAPHREQLRAAALAKLSEDVRAAHLTPPERRTAAQKEHVEKTERFLVVKTDAVVQKMPPADRERHKTLLAELKGFDGRKPAPLPSAAALRDAAEVPRTFVLERGERGNPGDEVRPGYLIALSPDFRPVPARVTPPRPTTTGRRLALAEWMASEANALAARVMVNRVWQYHFGRGIVGTPNDFGLRGEPPTHPELLDWLAAEFRESGWSVKHLHRLMLTSATYQQSTRAAPGAAEKDPSNRLFGRANRKRLEGEVIRDGLLAVSGRLNRKAGGPGVFPPVPVEALAGFKGWSASPDPRDHVRRSVYIFARRNLRFPFLEAFDLPDSNLSCPRRERSTTAPQALALLNSSDVTAAADALADRVRRESAKADEHPVLAYRLSLGRRPTATELRLAAEFLEHSPLTELCRALFNVNEFVYVD